MGAGPAAGMPLSDLLVIDLTRARSGPTCVRQLADWGADVIKIEPPPSSGVQATITGGRLGFDFQNLHRNKRSLTLDLKAPEGRQVLLDLAKTADVVVENFRPLVKQRLGIDYETLREVNPRIIYGSISGFGQSGPYRDRPGFDQIAQGLGGIMSVTGLPGQGPVRAGVPIADLSAGHFLAQGILLALLERARSGEGQWVHTSLLEAQIAMMDFQAARWLIERDLPGQAGNDHPTSIPTGVFPTSDGHINIAASGQPIYERFCKAIGAPGLIEHPDYADGEARSANRKALNARTLRDHEHPQQRRVDRGPQRGRRALRADLPRRRDGRGRAGTAPPHRPAGGAPHARRDRARRAADAARAHLAAGADAQRRARTRRAQRRGADKPRLRRRGDRRAARRRRRLRRDHPGRAALSGPEERWRRRPTS